MGKPSCRTATTNSEEVRKQILESIRSKALAIADLYNAPQPEIQISEGTPSLWNDEELAARAGKVFRRVLGDEHVEQAELSMGGEDFSRYGKAGVPIIMFRLGTIEKRRLDRYDQLGQKPPSLHSPLFYPDAELTIATAVTVTAELALDLLRPKGNDVE